MTQTSPAALKAAALVKRLRTPIDPNMMQSNAIQRATVLVFSEAADMIEAQAAIIAKHFPSPVAAEGDVERVARACPFCGSQPDSYSQAPNSRIWAVKCNVCPVMCYATGDTEEQAIALWNSRYIPFDYMPTYDEALRFIKSNPKTARAALSAQPASVGGGDVAQMDRDIGILLANIDFQAEATGEGPEGEDAGMIVQIRADHIARAASPTAIEPQAGWRTMESAPRDGTRILVWVPFEMEPYVVHWAPNSYDPDVSWTLDSGESAVQTYDPPSHWQPLPQPPANRRE